MTRNMRTASKMYRNTSVCKRYPSLPSAYSATRNTDRIRINTLAAYSAFMCLRHGIYPASDCPVGLFDRRRWNVKALHTKKQKKIIWTKRPPRMTLFPVSWFPLTKIPAPIVEDCQSMYLTMGDERIKMSVNLT